MVVSICIGSSCHLKGSREVVREMSALVKEKQVEQEVELIGSFCNGQCLGDVCVTIDGEIFSLKPEDTKEFFEKEIMGRIRG
ncbi:MAG: (2Fe-2S) ferredoxin domain-containing protein [Lachnospiraceae bacterium]|nr:(2Fe-2S) ferredoxin domain-containing protein [Lachnospiraceae bacterium]